MICTSKGSSYINNPGGEPLKYLTIGNIIENAARIHDQVDAIVSVYDNRRLTYGEVLQKSDKLAAGLISLGLKKGDRIGLWGPNIVEWVIAFFASARAGFITVPINPMYQPDELKYCLNKCDLKALICPDEYKSLKFYEILCHLLPELETCDHKDLSSGIVPTLKIIITISHRPMRGTYNYYEVLNAASDTAVATIRRSQKSISPEDICNIQFSSGTTGKPKAACLTHFQLVNNSYQVGKKLEMYDDYHKLCIQVPLFHVFGIVICILPSAQFGATLVFPTPTYNSKANLNALEQERCTIVYGTPTMYHDLINSQSELNKQTCLSKAVIGAAPWSPNLLNRIKEVFNVQQIMALYGATETTAITFLSLLKGKMLERKTVGRIGECIEAKIVDPEGNVVPFGTAGELYIRGYLTMVGYWEEPETTKEVLDSQRWLRTGDQFVLDEDGFGQVVGRLKDMIIRGGENVFPKEIEDFLSTHSDIDEVHVIGIDNERLGEEICACVRLKNGNRLSLDDLKEFCNGKIAKYKIPSQLRIVQTFPKTTSGKIQKYRLREQFNIAN